MLLTSGNLCILALGVPAQRILEVDLMTRRSLIMTSLGLRSSSEIDSMLGDDSRVIVVDAVGGEGSRNGHGDCLSYCERRNPCA